LPIKKKRRGEEDEDGDKEQEAEQERKLIFIITFILSCFTLSEIWKSIRERSRGIIGDAVFV